ncbi:MAG: Carboxy-terminal processing protease CtpA precursor [Firmicutes bacterium ADurb.Bin193]|nr:MAG: Carboxy-terminal processing protease CtpA precursor [Firmicutes bacterium ADurb.Bin193]
MNTKKALISFVLCLALCFTYTFADGEDPKTSPTDGEKAYTLFDQIVDFTAEYYRFGITKEELLDSALEGILKNHPELFDELMKGAYDALDENSRYLSLEENGANTERVTGQFEGIGINVSEYNGITLLGKPIKGSPAHIAGLMPGDRVLKVNKEDITGYVLDKTISLIKGEKGTSVELEILRDGQVLTFTIVRDLIKINPVEYYALGENNAGYVSISSFNANTTEYLEEALYNLASQGVDKVILDLRNNLGGFLREAISVASYFIPDDSLVITEDFKDPINNSEYRSYHTDLKFKAVVLVNEYSASASEIVAAAISDNKCGVLVGQTTFGKGTVQDGINIKNGGAIWLTIAKYLTPGGKYIHEVGIEPEYLENNKKVKLDITKLEAITGERILKNGDRGKDVLAVEHRLDAMGFYIQSVDEIYDSYTAAAVTAFQSSTGLFPYGVADITTQIKIADEAAQAYVIQDRQLEKAKELILNPDFLK